MLPRNLQAAHFNPYPQRARKLAVEHLALFRELPLSFLPGLLRELIEYDYKFPAERTRIDEELAILSALSSAQRTQWFHGFEGLTPSASPERIEWVTKPAQFVEQESAYLWTTHQLDAFREAAVAYGDRLQAARPITVLPMQRLGIAVIGQGVSVTQEPLFRALRAHGTHFTQIKPEGGFEALLAAAEARAKSHPADYGHWYVDGGTLARPASAVTTVGYDALAPTRDRLLRFMETQIAKPGMGPEELRTSLAQLAPMDLGMGHLGDAVFDRFQLKLFTEGSGTQIFSTTFAQWTTREVLRRAEPLTLLVRYAPRQRQKPMNELLAQTGGRNDLDPVGSLIDADMAAYYHWLNQQRLRGSERSAFIVWWEDQSQAVVIAPALPGGVSSNSPMTMDRLVALATG